MRILIVEDLELQREALKKGLSATGYVIDACADGEEGLWHATHETYDLLIVDIMLPKLNGLEMLRRTRLAGVRVPVLLLTARDSVEDRVEGLDLGADDYLSKPFSFSELLARVRALIRRSQGQASTIITVGELQIDMVGRMVRRAGVEIPLTPREFAVLEVLIARADSVVMRSELCAHLYEFASDPDSNALDVFISRLRRKLSGPGQPPLIHTRRGHGYLFSTTASA